MSISDPDALTAHTPTHATSCCQVVLALSLHL